MNPLATAFIIISKVKTTVKIVLHVLRIFLSVDLVSLKVKSAEHYHYYQGGIVGLSTASVMQLAAMKVRMMKSNQS